MSNPLLALDPRLNPFALLGAAENDSIAQIESLADDIEEKIANGLPVGIPDLKPTTASTAASLLRDPVIRLYFAACHFGTNSSIGDSDDHTDWD